MAQLTGKIKSVAYKKILSSDLAVCENLDANDWGSRCCLKYDNFTYAVSKWVSPKRTRSYPYSRVYDTLNTCGGRVITIIPIVKDEGFDGDMDYIQWDTISLMSLLSVYVIPCYYVDADKNNRKGRKTNKITNQKLDSDYIISKIKELNIYISSPLHWNLNQLKPDNLALLLNKTIENYNNISQKLCVKMHDPNNIEKFQQRILEGVNNFMNISRVKAKQAQNREVLTTQPKESLSSGEKMTIEIENYLGGSYFLTVDDVIIEKDKYYLIESKHTVKGLLPSEDDIKDGLLKMFIYSNIDELKTITGKVNFKPVLRLTSNILKNKITDESDEKTLSNFININNFNDKQKKLVENLIEEAKTNNFGLILETISGDKK